MTQDEFINKSNKIHNNKYDYSLVKYINTNIKVKLICPIHGIFEQIPKSHLKGHGCSKCANNNKSTTEDFIRKSIEIHGNKYDYSLVVYRDVKTKVKIICPIHGVFEQIPNSHLGNHGCPKCYGNEKKTLKEYLKECKEIHGDKYDYSLVDYKNGKNKIKIICKNHGIFEQSPIKHIRGQGCPKCAQIIRTHEMLLSTEDFIKKSKNIHGDKYDYSLVNYNGSFNKVKIICSIHGIFEQTPASNLHGAGCKKCANKIIGKKLLSNTNDFIKKSNIVHNNYYIYNETIYKNAITKVIITCPIHGNFEQIPNAHLNGVGCPNCQKSKGELKIKKYLEDNNFIYKEQYKFDNCKNILPLPFDFYLPVYNLCIEYDGEQHFRKFRFEKSDNELLFRQQRDEIKTKFCEKNKIKLLRIKYIDMKKIDKILNEYLKNI
jgi:very-short-patch-repair endonuclease